MIPTCAIFGERILKSKGIWLFFFLYNKAAEKVQQIHKRAANTENDNDTALVAILFGSFLHVYFMD